MGRGLLMLVLESDPFCAKNSEQDLLTGLFSPRREAAEHVVVPTPPAAGQGDPSEGLSRSLGL